MRVATTVTNFPAMPPPGQAEAQVLAAPQLKEVAVPVGLAGRPYGECFMHLLLTRRLVAMGLYRRKSENPGTRLSYVVCSPPWEEALEPTDRVFVLRPRTAAGSG